VNTWQTQKQKRDCLVHFLRLLAVCWQARKVHETTTLLLVTLPNIYRFKTFFTLTLSKKSFLIWLLITPPHLKYAATLPCKLSIMACFANINVSQGSVETCARCSRIFSIPFNCKFTKESSSEKKICKSVKI